ncbi:hypothetical protein PoB_003363200 [Plakobranchus ocellatus]|uniref:Uncharacterized protein n=1 Tax=Plakobranchus ocellatus TaxID=259542 RepID=A0AAV4AJE7_9GAST|nr:hypothetical protein PoB_003363200 [Plakobranchus ocellatus]
MVIFVKELKATGPEGKELPKAPKRKLSSLLQSNKKIKTEDFQELHKYLKSKEIDTQIRIDKKAFVFKVDEVSNSEIGLKIILKGFRQINRTKALGLFFVIRQGEALEKLVKVFSDEKEAKKHTFVWEDWTRSKTGESRSNIDKYRYIGRRFGHYKRFWGVGISFDEFYNKRTKILEMLQSDETVAKYWLTNFHDIFPEEEQQHSQTVA